MKDKIKEQVEKEINTILEQGIQDTNLHNLYELVDIHKDLANEEYWEEKKEVMQMRYRGYGNYGNEYSEGNYGEENYGRRGVPGTGRRYREGGSYGRRGVPGTGRGRYRGEEMMDEMHGAYQEYSEGKEQFEAGNYGAKSNTLQSLDYMMQSVVDFIEMLKKDASSHEEVQLIQKYTKEISEM